MKKRIISLIVFIVFILIVFIPTLTKEYAIPKRLEKFFIHPENIAIIKIYKEESDYIAVFAWPQEVDFFSWYNERLSDQRIYVKEPDNESFSVSVENGYDLIIQKRKLIVTYIINELVSYENTNP